VKADQCVPERKVFHKPTKVKEGKKPNQLEWRKESKMGQRNWRELGWVSASSPGDMPSHSAKGCPKWKGILGKRKGGKN